jgi:asparagine synthase (glutamine-hydrolysing)
MCGIIFVYNLNEQSKNINYEKVLETLKHRGPDLQKYKKYKDGKVFFGFTRLSIVNPKIDGMQPFEYNDCKKILMSNGEIYNMKYIQNKYNIIKNEDNIGFRSDIDLIGASWEKNNSFNDIIRDIDGDFAVVAYDIETDTVYAARDLVGVKPLYYSLTNQNIIFASEVKTILELGVSCKNIKQFLPNSIWNSKEPDKFIQIRSRIPLKLPKNIDTKKIIYQSLYNAVEKRINHGDREVGFLCSGGIDSSIITYLAKKICKTSIRAFTIKFGSYAPDAVFAEMLCKELDIKLDIITFTQEDINLVLEDIIKTCETSDIRTIRAAIPGYLLAKYISEKTDIKVVLSGEISDELFQGYGYFSKAPNRALAAIEGQRLINNIHSFDLLRAERVFSAHGLEIRVPYGDKTFISIIEALAADPNGPIFKDKNVLRDIFRNCKELQCIIDRPKECFSDGCGYDFVSSLMRNLGGTTANERFDLEIESRKKIFNKHFPGITNEQLYIKREMPSWIDNSEINSPFLD